MLMDVLAALGALAGGLWLLVWSSDRFVDGAAATARILGMPALLIGMVIVGFGTSAPEMTVSALASHGGNAGLALGNAYGSNTANIGLILGVSAVIAPLAVARRVLFQEVTWLIVISFLAAWQLSDGLFSRFDAWVSLGVFAALLTLSVRQGLKHRRSADDAEREERKEGKEAGKRVMSVGKAVFWDIAGLVLLVISSQILVWGAVRMAKILHVSDLVIGLTIVAVGTSLPELASSISASRKGENDIALGNIIGSNFFNTLAVVGLAGAIREIPVDHLIIARDIPAMLVATVSIFLFGWRRKGDGIIGKKLGILWLAGYAAYVALLIWQAASGAK